MMWYGMTIGKTQKYGGVLVKPGKNSTLFTQIHLKSLENVADGMLILPCHNVTFNQ